MPYQRAITHQLGFGPRTSRFIRDPCSTTEPSRLLSSFLEYQFEYEIFLLQTPNQEGGEHLEATSSSTTASTTSTWPPDRLNGDPPPTDAPNNGFDSTPGYVKKKKSKNQKYYKIFRCKGCTFPIIWDVNVWVWPLRHHRWFELHSDTVTPSMKHVNRTHTYRNVWDCNEHLLLVDV